MKNSSASAAMNRDSIITTCPDCGAFVKLPSCVNIDATVQCPSCSDRYPVRALLPDSIPELIVVRDDAQSTQNRDAYQVGETETANQMNIVASVPSLLEVPDILRNGARRRRKKSGRSGSGSPNSESARSREVKSGKSGRKRSARNRSSHSWAEESRRQIKPRQPVVEFCKILLGGLLALPVAQIIIWWLIGMDPLGIAPSVSRAVPFVVPANLKPADQDRQNPGVGLLDRTVDHFRVV